MANRYDIDSVPYILTSSSCFTISQTN